MSRIGELFGSIIGLLGGGIFGAKRGAHIGIVAKGLGIPGTKPLMVICCIIGLLSGNKIGSEIDRSK